MTKTEQPVDYSKPLENIKHERFSQEYHKSLNGTESYKAAYPAASQKSAEASASKLLENIKVKGRIVYLQSLLSAACGVDAQMLMEEWKKIGFANIKGVVGSGNKIEDISSLSDEVTAAISSIANTRAGVKITMHSKETALENLGKHIGFYERDNRQKAENLADFLKAMKDG